MEKMMMKKEMEDMETKRSSTDLEEKMDESKVAKRLLEEQIKKMIDSSKMIKWPEEEEEEKKDDPLLQEAIREQQARAIKQEAVDMDVKSESSTDSESGNDFRMKMETKDDENLVDLKEDFISEKSNPDSSDDAENNLKDNERTDDREADLNISGPSTSTGGVSKQQIAIAKSSKGLQTGPKVVTTSQVPLRIITKKLACTMPGCTKVVKSRKSLNRHLLSSHQFKEYRCLMRRCHDQEAASFSTRTELTTHIRQVHGNLSRWTCICSKKVNSYAELKSHYWLNHELGHFTCSAEDCTFRSTTSRASVQFHTTFGHDEQRKFPCPVEDCGKAFKQKWGLTVHLRVHRNDKCFECTWPGCGHSATTRSAVIVHIRMVHFGLPRTKKRQAEADIKDDRDPRLFLAKV